MKKIILLESAFGESVFIVISLSARRISKAINMNVMVMAKNKKLEWDQSDYKVVVVLTMGE